MNDPSYSLDVIEVASPCHESWEGMRGTESVRFCDACKMNVYNISELSREKAKSLIEQHEGRLCVRFYRRNDGTVITRDCPVGLRAVRKRILRAAASAVAMIVFLCGGFLYGRAGGNNNLAGGAVSRIAAEGPLMKFSEKFFLSAAMGGMMEMGDIVAPLPQTPPAPKSQVIALHPDEPAE